MTLEIAMRLQKLRKEKGFSQEELADKLGVSRQAVSKWERAEASPDTDNLILLSRLYEISLDELLNSSETTEEIKEEQNTTQPDENKTPCDVANAEKTYGGEHNAEISEICLKNDDARNADEKTETDEDLFKNIDDAKPEKRKSRKIANVIECSVVLLSTMVYLLLGTLKGCWHPAWIVFFAIPVGGSLCESIRHRKASEFAYPVLVAAVYLFLGFWGGWWHPGWTIFLTIPLYYAVVGIFEKN